jgi:hypothetical protein
MTLAPDLKELLDKSAEAGDLPPEDRASAEVAAQGAEAIPVPGELVKDDPAPAPGVSQALPAALTNESDIDSDIRNAISKMTIPQKIKLALFGNSVCRMLLIRDPNRMIQNFVLKNPKLGLKEIEEFARNPNLSEWVLRGIAGSQSWTKSYVVKANLVFNPKTPLDISLKWVRYLNTTDVRKLSKSKSVPQVLSTVAKKLSEEK